jgi:hypothetical protein
MFVIAVLNSASVIPEPVKSVDAGKVGILPS